MNTTNRKPIYSHLKAKAYASNRAFIQKAIDLSDLEYNAMELETGCLFLEQLFSKNLNKTKLYKEHAYQSGFWNWWHQQWKNWDDQLIKFLIQQKVELTLNFWSYEMQQMIQDRYIKISFDANYQKFKQNIANEIKFRINSSI